MGGPRLNTPAIDFYKAMGAEFLDEWRNVRVSGLQPSDRLAAAKKYNRCYARIQR